MPTYYEYDTQTTSYSPGLQFDNVPGITIGGGSTSSFFIPMILSQYNPPTHVQQLNAQPVIPNILPGGIAVGGNFVQAQGAQFPKQMLAGTIDIPLVADTETGTYAGTDGHVSAIQLNSIPMHWVTVISCLWDGRFGFRLDPTYYMDPYGRQYNAPRIVDFTASYIAGVPARANFTMTLMVPRSSI